MNSKKLRRLYAKLIILVLCFLIIARIFVLVLSKYESISNSETQTSQTYETGSEIETANSPAAEKATEAITPKPTIKPTTEPTNKPTNKLEKNDNQTVFFVWIPKTGTKYHSLSTCSNMRNPSKVTEQEAVRRGFSPCKKCW